MKRLVAVLIPVLIIAGLVAWRVVQKRSEEAALQGQRAARAGTKSNVAVAVAERRDLRLTFEATGTLEAPQQVTISPKIGGRISYLQAQEGDAVSRGQVLVRLDSAEIEAQVQQQQAAVAEAESRLAQAMIAEVPADVSVSTQISQQSAALATTQADLVQATQNLESQVATAQAGVTEVQGRISSAQAATDSARANIASARANLDNANIRLKRVLELYEQGFIAAQDVDDARAEVSVREASVNAAEGATRSAEANHAALLAQLQAAEERVKIARSSGQADIEAARQRVIQASAALDSARANTAQRPAYRQGLAALRASADAARASLASARARRADTVITSPLDGHVTARHLDPGDMAGVGQPILSVQFFKQVWVTISVPDDVAARTHMGQDADVWFDALPGQSFIASVVQINPAADPQTRQFTVRAIMSNTEDLFRPGMFAHVALVVEEAPQIVAVPREAVQSDDSGEFVMVVDAEHKARRRPVRTGLATPEQIGIESGLEPGERVVTVSATPLREGQEVRTGDDTGARGGGDRPPREGGPPTGEASSSAPGGGAR